MFTIGKATENESKEADDSCKNMKGSQRKQIKADRKNMLIQRMHCTTTKKIYTFSPYPERKRNERQTLLVFKGNLRIPEIDATNNKSTCSTLVDGGCISRTYADKLGLRKTDTNLKAHFWDGKLVPMELCSEKVTLQMGNAIFNIQPYVVDLITYDIILGKSWLYDYNPLIDWRKNRISSRF